MGQGALGAEWERKRRGRKAHTGYSGAESSSPAWIREVDRLRVQASVQQVGSPTAGCPLLQSGAASRLYPEPAVPRRRGRLHRFLTQGGTVEPRDPRYRRVLLLNFSLLVLVLSALFYGGLNLLLGDRAVVTLNLAVGLCSLALLAWYRHRDRLEPAAWALVLLVGLYIVGYLCLVGVGHYSLLWLGVFPGLAYFLLGRRNGLLTSLGTAGLAVSGLWLWAPASNVAELDLRAYFNLAGALLCLTLFAYYSELSRQHTLAALVETNRQLQQLSTHDRLTGLYNRLKLEQRLAEELVRARRHGSVFSLVLVDIDHFKRVNDQCGHAVGDLVLQCLGHLMLRDRRASDVVGRWGGEEFLLICPQTPAEGALMVAERLRAATQDAPMPEAGRVTLSAGVAAWRPSDSIDSLLARADAALYAAKSGGRNRVCLEAGADGATVRPPVSGV